MLLVVLSILSIVLMFPHQPPFRWVQAPGWTLAAVAIATVLPGIIGFFVNWGVLLRFETHPDDPARGQAFFSRGAPVIHAALALGHAAVLLCTDWLVLCGELAGFWLLLPGMLALLPFVLSVLLAWTVLYPADRAVRQLALEIYLFRGKPLRKVWSLGEYLLFNLRHQILFILIPMVLILAARDLVVHYDKAIRSATGIECAGDLALGATALLVALIAPEILRQVWVTRRLPDGPLRDRLLLLCERLRLRCREILVWRSGGMVVNAAVMGVVAPFRYVLITDAMLEQLEDTKIEAVFGHEAGHVKRHHILFFLMFALISGCIVLVFSVRMGKLSPNAFQTAEALLIGLLVVKWGLLFGWISRRFERQADIFGVRTLALAGLPCKLPCMLHNPGESGRSPHAGDPLCATAAQLFGHALNEIALLNGIRPEARSWRHSSISSRSRFVQGLAQDPLTTRRFEQTVLWIKLGIFAAAVLCSLWASIEIGLWQTISAWVHSPAS